MIVETIADLFFSVCILLVECALGLAEVLFNFLALGIELVVGLFVTGFHVARWKRPKRERLSAFPVGGVLVLAVAFGFAGWFTIVPAIENRSVTLVTDDGSRVLFAAMIIHTPAGEVHTRTDRKGKVVIPRFSTTTLTVKDPRYVERKWTKAEIESKLVVRPTALGSGLDVLADQLLKPAGR